jgi:putative ABC transport system ATP-binding protein
MSDAQLTRYRRHDVGIVFQQFNLIPTMTAQENVELPGLLAGRPARELRERSAGLLAELGLIDRATHRPEALSGGEQQRVAIARALLFGPTILLADEPTGNLDSRASEALWSLLAKLAGEKGMMIVMVTHEPAAAAHCRRVIVLGDGVVRGAFDVDGMDATGLSAQYQLLSRPAQ